MLAQLEALHPLERHEPSGTLLLWGGLTEHPALAVGGPLAHDGPRLKRLTED